MVNKPRYIKSKIAGKSKLPVIPTSLQFILHYFLLRKQWRRNLPSYQSHTLKANPYRIFQYYKHFGAVCLIKYTALSDINIRYATKKRNPE